MESVDNQQNVTNVNEGIQRVHDQEMQDVTLDHNIQRSGLDAILNVISQQDNNEISSKETSVNLTITQVENQSMIVDNSNLDKRELIKPNSESFSASINSEKSNHSNLANNQSSQTALICICNNFENKSFTLNCMSCQR